MLDCEERIGRVRQPVEEAGIGVLLLTKPAYMFYLTGDGRLCACAMITKRRRSPWACPRLMWRMLDSSPIPAISPALRMR